MNVRNETEIIQVNKDMVVAQQNDIFVAVIKIKPSRMNQAKYAIVIPKSSAVKNQRTILRKEHNELKILMKLKVAIILFNIYKRDMQETQKNKEKIINNLK
ncbi:hypothetical protein RCG24_10510 [Neobacillus sp. OS1-32]|uniref:hypothetical protein n=1 Tax=Neobacillus sp. OS1-32 TaxID=3070682 RepID=UPI0027E03A96|nr:hypothetical protein [Neobacillus sp. OS1-32]WML32234.1 hypothetical protein RCG24_10510 [Neobacillus sp. OS1-32]